jgi:hypothetical protein
MRDEEVEAAEEMQNDKCRMRNGNEEAEGGRSENGERFWRKMT